MGKCKNIECVEATKGKRVYCSMKCRNYYVNKYMRDYSKISTSLSKPARLDYSQNIKHCVTCNSELPYEKRDNKYCDSSCAATTTNTKRVGIKYKMSEKGLNSLRESAYINLVKNRNYGKDREEEKENARKD